MTSDSVKDLNDKMLSVTDQLLFAYGIQKARSVMSY